MTPPSDVYPLECDLCQGTEYEQIGSQDRLGKPLATVVCKTCGLVRHAAIPNEEELHDYYAARYRLHYHGEETPSDRRIMRAWRHAEKTLPRLIPFFPQGARVLDIGAGIGCFIKQLAEQGYAAEGIEPNRGFQRFAQQSIKAKVAEANLFDLKLSGEWDVVTMTHVIEHFRSPRAALMHVLGLLKPGGVLWLNCPNLTAPFAPQDRMFHSAHIHNFTHCTLIALAQSCGFKLVKQYSNDRSMNLDLILQSVRGPWDATVTTNRLAYQEVLNAVRSAATFRYYLRGRYIRARIKRTSTRIQERLFAKGYAERLLARLAGEESRKAA